MKSIIVAALSLLSFNTYADLTCDGREIRAGEGRSGRILVGGNTFSLRWQGDSTDLIGKGVLCGVPLNATTVCQTIDQSSGPTQSARMLCADKDKSPFNNTVGQGYYVFSEVNGVGRFGCSNVGGTEKVETLIEINNCR